jgi:hypothetical protein
MGTEWTLEIDDARTDDGDADAKTFGRRQQVVLHSQAEEPVTLLHELVHVIEYSLGFQLSHEVVEPIARGLTSILADNPKLVRYIVDSL